MYACLHAPGNLPLLIECARGFSPHIETNPPDTVVFDVRGLESLYGPFFVSVGLLFWAYVSGLILFAGAQFSVAKWGQITGGKN